VRVLRGTIILYVPWVVIKRYMREKGVDEYTGTLYQPSLINDKITTVWIPDIFARAYRNFTRGVLSKKVPDKVRILPTIKQWEEHRYDIGRIEQLVLEDLSGERETTVHEIPKGRIAYMRVAQRYVTTHLLFLGVYRLLDKIVKKELKVEEERGIGFESEVEEEIEEERKKLKRILRNLTLERLDAIGVRSFYFSRKVRDYQGKITFMPKVKKEDYVTMKICLPTITHGFVMNRLSVTTLSSILAYSIALEGCQEDSSWNWFNDYTKNQLLEVDIPAFERELISVALNLQILAEVDSRADEITDFESLKQHLYYYLRAFHTEEPFTYSFDLPQYVNTYGLTGIFGHQAYNEVLRALEELVREGAIVERERGWYFGEE